jgi:hypothetical protein
MAPVDKVRARAIERQAIEAEQNIQRAIRDIHSGENIWKVLARRDVPRAEIHKFFSDQWRQWQSRIIQNYQVTAGEASVKPVQPSDMLPHNSQNELGNQGEQLLRDGFMGKAMKTSKGVGKEAAPLTLEELTGDARELLGEWDGFMGDLWSSVLDQQMVKDYESRMNEIQSEVRRIIALAKAGVVGPEFVLIALAKVNAAKNGVLFTWLTKKAYGLNEEMARASKELYEMDASDPAYFGTLQHVQAETREGGFQMNIITNDLQKVMQNVSSTMETVHGIMGEINRFRREVITKIAAR